MQNRNTKVVFDLDRTLVIAFPNYTDLELLLHDHPWLTRFSSKQIVLATCLHFILPGAIEMMQWLRSKQINLAFYSHGNTARNEALVKALLTEAWGEERYNRHKDQIKIISGHDDEGNILALYAGDAIKSRKQQKKYGFGESLHNLKKDLRQIVSEDELVNTIFVEDDPNSIYYAQEKCLLQTLGADAHSFSSCYNGKLKKSEIRQIYAEVNCIFHITGLLKAALKDKDELNEDATDSLFQRQFTTLTKSCLNTKTYRIDEHFLTNNFYALQGEVVLKRYNKGLNRLSCENFSPKSSVIFKANNVRPDLFQSKQEKVYYTNEKLVKSFRYPI